MTDTEEPTVANNTISRRTFLKMAVATGAGLLASCVPGSTEPSTSTPTPEPSRTPTIAPPTHEPTPTETPDPIERYNELKEMDVTELDLDEALNIVNESYRAITARDRTQIAFDEDSFAFDRSVPAIDERRRERVRGQKQTLQYLKNAMFALDEIRKEADAEQYIYSTRHQRIVLVNDQGMETGAGRTSFSVNQPYEDVQIRFNERMDQEVAANELVPAMLWPGQIPQGEPPSYNADEWDLLSSFLHVAIAEKLGIDNQFERVAQNQFGVVFPEGQDLRSTGEFYGLQTVGLSQENRNALSYFNEAYHLVIFNRMRAAGIEATDILKALDEIWMADRSYWIDSGQFEQTRQDLSQASIYERDFEGSSDKPFSTVFAIQVWGENGIRLISTRRNNVEVTLGVDPSNPREAGLYWPQNDYFRVERGDGEILYEGGGYQELPQSTDNELNFVRLQEIPNVSPGEKLKIIHREARFNPENGAFEDVSEGDKEYEVLAPRWIN